MMSQPYVDGITDTVTHDIASSLTAGHIAADRNTLSVAVIPSPVRYTSRDGRAFAGQVADMDVCTGEITIKLTGSRPRDLPLTRLCDGATLNALTNARTR